MRLEKRYMLSTETSSRLWGARRGGNFSQAVLLIGALLTLQSTVYSADDVPVSTPNVYPNLEIGSNSTIEQHKTKQRRKDGQSKREKPLAPQPSVQTDENHPAANVSPSHLVDDLPIAAVKKTVTISKSSGLYPVSASEKRLHREFMDWCKQALGIQTILEIQTFDYYDYVKAMPMEDWDDNSDDDTIDSDIRPPPVESFPTIPVRGLAATRDIAQGETIIRIPVQALFSVATTIDNDPVLSRVMGPEARRKHGWDEAITDDDNNDDAANADGLVLEIPLLAVALLHHKKLGASSPLSPYFRILERTPVDSFPFLWSNAKLKAQVSEGIRTVARGIKREIKDMYAAVVQVLVDEHPDIFSNTTGRVPRVDLDSPEEASKDSETVTVETRPEEWMFSLEHFQWAFAIINSRHWQLPIPDLTAGHLLKPPPPLEALSAGDDPLLPPAGTPTDHWIQDQALATETNRTLLHSFLAPVADMLNFGPPCTRGRYDEATHMFEIIASCSFLKGQEVTFWYSNECDHIMVGVYGFTHPLVPKCPSAEEYRRASEEWQRQAKNLDEELERKNQLVAQLDAEVAVYQDVLDRCTCCRYEKAESLGEKDDDDHRTTLLRHEHVRGAGHNGEEHGRRRVRKKQVDDEEGDEF